MRAYLLGILAAALLFVVYRMGVAQKMSPPPDPKIRRDENLPTTGGPAIVIRTKTFGAKDAQAVQAFFEAKQAAFKNPIVIG
jgi:hypothetical protein